MGQGRWRRKQPLQHEAVRTGSIGAEKEPTTVRVIEQLQQVTLVGQRHKTIAQHPLQQISCSLPPLDLALDNQKFHLVLADRGATVGQVTRSPCTWGRHHDGVRHLFVAHGVSFCLCQGPHLATSAMCRLAPLVSTMQLSSSLLASGLRFRDNRCRHHGRDILSLNSIQRCVDGARKPGLFQPQCFVPSPCL